MQALKPTVEKIKIFFRSDNSTELNKNLKNVLTLRDEALQEESVFKLKILNEHRQSYNKRANIKRDFLSITFKFLLLLMLDLYYPTAQSSMQLIANNLPATVLYLILLLVLALLWLWLEELFQTDDSEYLIKWPPEKKSH